MQAYKPGSVPSRLIGRSLIIYLVPILLSGSSDLPVAQVERAAPHYLFGLSTRKVYHAPAVTIRAVSSYLTFSPFPPPDTSRGGSLFSVALSVSDPNPDSYRDRDRSLPVRKCDALCCPDFPFRPDSSGRNDKTACSTKLVEYHKKRVDRLLYILRQ